MYSENIAVFISVDRFSTLLIVTKWECKRTHKIVSHLCTGFPYKQIDCNRMGNSPQGTSSSHAVDIPIKPRTLTLMWQAFHTDELSCVESSITVLLETERTASCNNAEEWTSVGCLCVRAAWIPHRKRQRSWGLQLTSQTFTNEKKQQSNFATVPGNGITPYLNFSFLLRWIRYARTHARMHARMHARTHAHTYTCARTLTHTHTHKEGLKQSKKSRNTSVVQFSWHLLHHDNDPISLSVSYQFYAHRLCYIYIIIIYIYI